MEYMGKLRFSDVGRFDSRQDVKEHPSDEHKLSLENENDRLESVLRPLKLTCKPYTAPIIASEITGIAAFPMETMTIR
jgi:hypothetical protein